MRRNLPFLLIPFEKAVTAETLGEADPNIISKGHKASARRLINAFEATHNIYFMGQALSYAFKNTRKAPNDGIFLLPKDHERLSALFDKHGFKINELVPARRSIATTTYPDEDEAREALIQTICKHYGVDREAVDIGDGPTRR